MFRSILIRKWWVFNLLGAFCNCQTFFKCLISLSKSCKTIKKSKCYNSPSWHSHMQWLVLHFISITILLRELTNQTILTSGDNDDDCDAHYTCGGIRMFLDVIASLSTYPAPFFSRLGLIKNFGPSRSKHTPKSMNPILLSWLARNHWHWEVFFLQMQPM